MSEGASSAVNMKISNPNHALGSSTKHCLGRVAALVGLSFLVLAMHIPNTEALSTQASGTSESRQLPSSFEENLILPGKKGGNVPLFIHRMESSPPRVVSRAKLHQFVDETLLSPESTIRDEIDWGLKAGAQAIMQEGEFRRFFEAAQGTEMKLMILMNVAPMRASLSKIKTGDVSSIVNYFVRTLKEIQPNQDYVYQLDGRPVLLVFAAYNYSAETYQQLREGIRKAGFDPILLFQAHSIGMDRRPSTDEEYLQVFDGAFIWGGGYDITLKTLQRLAPLRKKIDNDKIFYLTTKAGHWRPEKGAMFPRRGTKEFRETLALFHQYDCDGIIVESWNDYSENHHVQPSMLNSTLMSDLCAFYGRLNAGELPTVETPGVYVSHVQELPRGSIFDLELLHLPVEAKAEKKIRLILKTADGNEVFRSDAWKVKGDEAKAITYSIPTADLPGRTLIPTVEIDGKPHATATFALIRDGRVERPNTIHSSLSNVLDLEKAVFSLDHPGPSSGPVANIKIAGDQRLHRIEVIRNDIPIYSASYERAMQELAPERNVHQIGFYWNAPGPVPDISRNFSGSVDVIGGKILQGFHPSKGLKIKHSDNHAHWKFKNYTPREAAQLVFTGDENTTFTFRMPTQNLEIQVRWSDVAAGEEKVFQVNPYTQLTVRRIDGPIGYPLSWNEESFDQTVTIPPGGERHPDVYHLRVVGKDGAIYRSPPVFASNHEKPPAQELLLWDDATDQRLIRSETWEDFRPVRWTFDQVDLSCPLPDEAGVGFPALPGGSYDRDGRIRPTQIPQSAPGKSGNALRFDGDDMLMVRPNLLPLGAWYLEMWIKPENVNSSNRQCLFHCTEVANLSLEDGILHLRFGDKTGHVDLSGQTALKNGQWYRVAVVYDLQTVRLLLNNELEAEGTITGYRVNNAGRTTFGARLTSKNMSGAVQGFQGLIDEITVGMDVANYATGGSGED